MKLLKKGDGGVSDVATHEAQAARPSVTILGSAEEHSSSRRLRIFVGVVASLALAAGVGYVVYERQQLPGDAVLRVGESVVTRDQYDRRLTVLSALYGVVPPASGKDADEFRRDAAKSVAVSQILDEAATHEGLSVGTKQAQAALDDLVAEQLPGGRDDFVKFLADAGVSNEDVLDEVRRQLLTSQLFDIVTADAAPVTSEEVRDHYESNRDAMRTAERRRLSNIVVATEREARQIVGQVGDRRRFSLVARQISLDGSSKDDGGDIGWVTRDQLEAAFGEEAFGVAEGKVFGPVQSQYGWNVGRVDRVESPKTLAFEDVSQQLAVQLQNERKLELWRDWLRGRIKAADVVYADSYRPADPDSPPTDSPTATR